MSWPQMEGSIPWKEGLSRGRKRLRDHVPQIGNRTQEVALCTLKHMYIYIFIHKVPPPLTFISLILYALFDIYI